MLSRILLLIPLAVALPLTTASAMTYGFGCITNNIASDCTIGEAQVAMDVTDEGGGQVRFTFTNSGPDASSIEGIYFDDGTLLGIASIINGAGVSYSLGAAPPNLPGGNMAAPPFVTTADFGADSNPPTSTNGVGPGEFVAIIFDLQPGGTYGDVLAELSDGTLRAGVHVIAYASGGSESFVNVVPEPGTLALALVGFAALGAARRRRS